MTVGLSLPLTGEFSQPGKAAKQGYEVWAETVNEEGGLLDRQVELEIKDDGSDQNTVVADYNALIQKDDVDLLLGTFSSLLNLPASAAAERNRMLYVEPAGGAPEIFERDFQYGPFFTQQATADHQGDLFAEWVLALPANERPKTVAYAVLDDPFTVPVVDALRATFDEAGIENVYDETYPVSTSNFDSIANSIKSENPDMVVNGSQFEDGIGFRRAADQGRLRAQDPVPDQRAVVRRAVLGRRRGREHRGHVLRHQPHAGRRHAGQRRVRRRVRAEVRRAAGRGRRRRLRVGPGAPGRG